MYNIKTSLFISCLFLTGMMMSCSQGQKKLKETQNLPFYQDATFSPHWLTTNSVEEKEFHRIPSFSMVNQDGDTITDKKLNEKIYVANFFFTTCPGICPKMTNNMTSIQEAFLKDDEIKLLSFSVTPTVDSVSVLKDYAINNDIQSQKWHLLTGNRSEIYDLGRNAYFIEEDLGLEKDKDDFIHTENIVLVDKNKHLRGIYNGLNKTAISQLIADIHTLKKETNQ